MIREEAQCRFVERGQPQTQQRRGTVGDDRGDQIARRDRTMKNRRAPELRRQRHRHEIAGPRVGLLPSATRRLTRGGQVRVGRRLAPFRRVVEETGDLVDEAAAVGSRIDSQRLSERDRAAGDRDVLGNSGGGVGVTRHHRQRAQQQNQQSGRRPAP
jgi:hypothetical protein